MNQLRYPSEIERAAEIDAQLQVEALLSRAGRRITDNRIDAFEALRADLGPYFALWVLAYLGVWFAGAYALALICGWVK